MGDPGGCTLCIVPLAVQYTIVDGFTGMGIAKVAVSLSMFRKLIYFMGMLVLPAVFGVEAVFLRSLFPMGSPVFLRR